MQYCALSENEMKNHWMFLVSSGSSVSNRHHFSCHFVIVVETMRRKKSRGLGVFQYAETVEGGVWDSAERQQGIQVSAPLSVKS